MPDEEIRIDLTIEDMKAEQTLKKTGRASKRMMDQFEKDSKRGARSGKRLEKVFARIKGQVVGLAAGFGAIQLGRKAVANFQEQEKAAVSLEAALIASEQAYHGLNQELAEYAANLQKATVHGDEQIMQGMALAISMGATTEQAKGLVSEAANLAVAFNIDLPTAIRQMAVTLSGQLGELGEKLPELRGLSIEERRGGGVIGVVRQKYGGMAERLAESESGRFTQILNRLNDKLEPIGERLVGILSLAAEGLDVATGWMPNLKQIRKGVSDTDGAALGPLGWLAGKAGLVDYDSPMEGESIDDWAARTGRPTKYYEAGQAGLRQAEKDKAEERRKQKLRLREEQRLEEERLRWLAELNAKLRGIGMGVLTPGTGHHALSYLRQDMSPEMIGRMAEMVDAFRSPQEKFEAERAAIHSAYGLFQQLRGGSLGNLGGIHPAVPGEDATISRMIEDARRDFFPEPEEVETEISQFSQDFGSSMRGSIATGIREGLSSRDAMRGVEAFTDRLGAAVVDTLATSIAEAFVSKTGLEAGIDALLGISSAGAE